LDRVSRRSSAGICGSSLAPLLYGIWSHPKWADVHNLTWTAYGPGFFSVFEKKAARREFLTLWDIHIRRAMIGEALRNLTQNEISVFSETLKKDVYRRRAGFSTGLAYVHSRETRMRRSSNLSRLPQRQTGFTPRISVNRRRNSGSRLMKTIRMAEG